MPRICSSTAPRFPVPAPIRFSIWLLFFFAALSVFSIPALGVSGSAVGQAKTYDYAGYRLSKWHRNPEAIVFYTAAIKANPSDYVAHFNRAGCYLEERDWAKALRDLNQALKLKPQNAAEIYGVRAIALFGLGRDTECRADLDRAKPRRLFTSPSPDDLRVSLCQTSLHPSPDEVKRSLAIVDRAVAQARTVEAKADALNDRAWFLAVCRAPTGRRTDQAIADATEACRLTHSRAASIIDTLAVAFARRGDFDKAIETEKKAVSLSWHDRRSRAAYQRRLARFEKHQPYYLTAADRG